MSNCPMGYQITFMISLSNITSWNVVRCFSINFSIFFAAKDLELHTVSSRRKLMVIWSSKARGKEKGRFLLFFYSRARYFSSPFFRYGLDLVYPRPRTPITTISKAFSLKKGKKKGSCFPTASPFNIDCNLLFDTGNSPCFHKFWSRIAFVIDFLRSCMEKGG